MTDHSGPAAPARLPGMLLVAALSACGGGEREARPEVVIRGTDPAAGAAQSGRVAVAAPTATADARGVVSYDTYQAVVARPGDTVADLAQRIGLSASELAAYNGLTPAHALRGGEELVLPAGPGGHAGGTALAAVEPEPEPSLVASAVPAVSSIQTAPLSGTGRSAEPAPVEVAGVDVPAGQPAAAEPATPRPAAANPARDESWSPDLAAAAIARSSGLDPDGTLGAPPSASEPAPEAPPEQRELQSPGLGQYQTGATGSPTAPPTPQLASIAPEPAAPPPPNVRLMRPVEGPVAVGFNKGSGPARNDGVDFAAAAGAAVVAAADGEVALVSQSLGGLGTIVLLRHPNDLLTVYGRIDNVTVRKGDIVQAGQRIGVVSNAAAPAEPRMHFEVRRGAESLDPMQFL